MGFLPENYERPVTASRYFKPQDGQNRIRILTPALVGWLDWNDKTPVRTKDRPEHAFKAERQPRHFWAFAIWDYQEAKIKIYEVTQASIQDSIIALHQSADWGEPTGYDLIITRSGKDLETKYTVVPVPPQPLAPNIKQEFIETYLDLNQLFVNGDPFQKAKADKQAENPVDNIPF